MNNFFKFNIDQIKSNKKSDKYFLDKVVDLNRITESRIQKRYLSFLSGFDNDKDGRLDNSNTNLSRIGGQIKILKDEIFTPYKSKFLKISNDSVKAIEKQQNDYFKKRNKILRDSGIEIKSVSIYTKNFSGILSKLDKNTIIQLNTVIDKWSKFYYDTLFRGIAQQQTIQKVIENLITHNGHIRIGSSFSQSTEANMLMSQVAKRTAFVQADAKKQGLDSVWNANPMDRRTKPICMRASLAGVISERAMADEYGFPPRWLCRCDAVYTRSEWTEINSGINQGIDERRLNLIDILQSDPASFQKSEWFIGKGKNKRKVIPKDAKRVAGEIFYKSIEDAIDLLTTNPVYGYDQETDFTGLPAEVQAQMSKRQIAALKNPKKLDRTLWNVANDSEQEIAKNLGGDWITGNRPFDAFLNNEFIEIKTCIDCPKGLEHQLSVKKASGQRKDEFIEKYGVRPHMVAYVKDKNSPLYGNLYYREGHGSFRLKSMQPVKDWDELLSLVNKKGALAPPERAYKKLEKFKDKNEAETWGAKNLVKKKADYDELSKETSQLVNEYLSGAIDRYGIKPENLIFDEKYFQAKNMKNVPAFATESGDLIFNPKFIRKENDLKKLVSEQFENGYWTTNSPGHLFRHEFSHLRYFDVGGTELTAAKKLSKEIKAELSKGIGATELPNYVSNYALKNEGEFYAEMIARELAGKQIHPVAKKIMRDIENDLKKQIKNKKK